MFRHTKICFNNNIETEYTSFGTYLCPPFHIVAFDIKTLVVPWHQFVYILFRPCGTWLSNQVTIASFIICQAFPSKVLLNFWKQEKVRRCQLRTVRRMHSHDHSCLCTYHVTRSDVQLHEATFNITLNTRNK